jgi:hypothetical protein
MFSPFPGMNPYLEQPLHWQEVHSRLMIAIADALNPQILPKYRAALDRRVYQIDGDDAILIGIPDVTVERYPAAASSPVAVISPPAMPLKVFVPMPLEHRESFLQVQDIKTGEVVTVIEVLSPTNKRLGQGRHAYEEKRRQVLGSRTHLVEIDLLRSGTPMTVAIANRPVNENSQPSIPGSYRILVSRGDQRPSADLYPFRLPDPIPCFSLPLRSEDYEPVLDLYTLLNQVYQRAGLGYAIDYRLEPIPPVEGEDAVWLDTLLKKQHLR